VRNHIRRASSKVSGRYEPSALHTIAGAASARAATRGSSNDRGELVICAGVIDFRAPCIRRSSSQFCPKEQSSW